MRHRHIHIDPGNTGGSSLTPTLEEYTEVKPSPIKCPYCDRKFETKNNLGKHISDKHNMECPVLYQGEYIIQEDEPLEIVNVLDLDRLETYACKKIKFSLNYKNMPNCRDLKSMCDVIKINEYYSDRCELILSNEHCEKKFILRIRIPDPEEISQIDEKFERIVLKKVPDMECVNKFAEECSGFSRSKSYYDGLCDYIHGVMKKQEHENTSVDTYKQHFNIALQKLNGYEGIYGTAIIDYINFNINSFSISETRVNTIPELDTAIDFFIRRQKNNLQEQEDNSYQNEKNGLDKLAEFILDDITDFIMGCITELIIQGELDKKTLEKLQVYETSNRTTPLDRVKCRVLLAEVSTSSNSRKKYLNKLLDTEFCQWAEKKIKGN